MNRAQFLEEVELYAARALSADEMHACDLFLRESADEECRTALVRAQRTWAAIGMSIDPVKPAERIWLAIARTLGGAHDAPARRTVSRWRERVAWAAVACALIAVAMMQGKRQAAEQRADQAQARAGTIEQQAKESAVAADTVLRNERTERDACSRALLSAQGDAAAKALALSIIEAPNARMVALAPQAGATQRATALLDLEGHRAALVASSMVASAAKDYELWIIRDGAKLAAGIIKPDANGQAVLALDQALLAGKIDAVAITLEPTGGSPQPTGSILLVVALKG